MNTTSCVFAGVGELDRTVFKKAGPGMRKELATFGVCNEGDVKLTGAYKLPAKHVLHAIPQAPYRESSEDVLRKIYRQIFSIAVSLNATSIVFPAIGTGSQVCRFLSLFLC